MCGNVEFEYLYRDASNYKFWNSIIFANPSATRFEKAEARIIQALDGREFFIADQVSVPEVFPFINGRLTEDDHCFHTFASLSSTTEAPNDTLGRSITEFVEEIEEAARHSWRVFDPHDRMR